MGAFESLVRGVANLSKSQSDTEDRETQPNRGQTRRMSVVDQKLQLARESAGEGASGTTVLKQDTDDGVNRRATLASDFTATATDEGGVGKPYDPELLRDLSQNPIAQAYIDTLSQDVASAEWGIYPRDSQANVPPDLLAKAERRFSNLFPDLTTEAVYERVSRNLLTLGDAVLVKHYSDDEEDPADDAEGGRRVAEAVPIDSSTFYKTTDDNNFVDGYVQVQGARSGQYEATPFQLNEVCWFSWSGRPAHIYGHSPVDKGQDTIEVLEEIIDKELLDLVQGMPPGILSRPAGDDSMAITDESDWSNFKSDMRLNEGERHRLAFTKFPVEYTPFSSNYQELQLLDRYRTKVTELGGVMKVNPSYAGFEFQNVNRATDESQREAFKQRGFRVLLRILENGLNAAIVPELVDEITTDPEFDDVEDTDLELRFERERTVGEKRERANMLREAVEAGGVARDRGLSVSFRDGFVDIEEGEIEETADEDGDGGLFMSDSSSSDAEAVKADGIRREEVEESYQIAGSEFDENEADRPVLLSYPHGGVAHSHEAGKRAWEAVFRDLLDRGATAVLDVKGTSNGRGVAAYPDSIPADHDPRIAVFGLSEEAVQSIVDLHKDVRLRARRVDGQDLYGGGSPK